MRRRKKADPDARPGMVGYCRVSTAEQATDGVSLDAQEAKIRAWALADDRDILGIFADRGLSGKRADNRPQLAAALEMVCEARGVLVVYSLARLARSVRDTMSISDRLERRGADLVSLSERIDTTSAAGKLFFRLMAALAEFERDLISERTATALRHLKAIGMKTGGTAPYGFKPDRDGSLVPIAAEQEVIALMQTWRADGESLRLISARLNAHGYHQKLGGPWTHVAVDRTLKLAGARACAPAG